MTTTQLSMLLRDLDDCREPDFVLLGICADAMQECEDEDWRGLRWAIERGKWPQLQSCGIRYHWWCVSGSKQQTIPSQIWDDEINNWWCVSGSKQQTIPSQIWDDEINNEITLTMPEPRPISQAFRDLASMLRKAESDGVDVSKL